MRTYKEKDRLHKDRSINKDQPRSPRRAVPLLFLLPSSIYTFAPLRILSCSLKYHHVQCLNVLACLPLWLSFLQSFFPARPFVPLVRPLPHGGGHKHCSCIDNLTFKISI